MVHDFHLQLAWDEPAAAFLINARSDIAGQTSGRLSQERLATLHAMQKELFHRAERSAAVTYGEQLFGALMGDAIRDRFHAAVQKAWSQGDLLRLILEFDADLPKPVQWIHGVCWEIMFDSQRDTFLAIDSDVLLVRYLRQPRPVRGAALPRGPLRVFATSACPPECKPLRLDEEINRLEEIFTWPRMKESIHAEVIKKIAFADVRGLLIRADGRGLPFHVWHHCGHGRFDEKSGEYQLAFEHGAPRTPLAGPWINAKEVAQLLGECPDLRLVFLNVCQGASPDGLGTLLAGLGVPAVIGHNVAVEDRIALKFSHEFWRAFATHPVDEAVQRARQVLAGSHNPLAFAQAVLFLRSLEPLSAKVGHN